MILEVIISDWMKKKLNLLLKITGTILQKLYQELFMNVPCTVIYKVSPHDEHRSSGPRPVKL
jgi:hypothetical protein